MATENVNIKIGSTFDGKGFKAAETATDKLVKSVGTLTRTFGVALGATALANFAKNSVKAFAADQAAAVKLTQAVKNLGLEFANPYITDYISNLEQTSKVADDQLRPAFQRLLQQTGSISKSQSILATSIDVSRGSAVDLATVTEDLARAYYGNTKSLKKYSLGLTDAELKAKSFSEIQTILDKKFKGASKAYLNTYQGQLDSLSLSFNNLQENAGKALFTLASGGTGNTTTGVKNLSFIIDAFGTGLVEAATLFSNAAQAFGQAYLGVASPKAVDMSKGPHAKAGQELFLQSSANDAKLKAIEKRQAALYKAQMDALKKITAEQKKQAALKKAGSVFDMDQIQLIAALKGKLSEDDRKRAELQLALLNENDTVATKLSKEILMAQDSTGKLYQFFLSIGDAKIKNPFSFLDEWLKSFQDKLNNLTVGKTTTTTSAGGGGTTISSTVSSNPIIQGAFDAVQSYQLAQGSTAAQAASLALDSARYTALGQSYAGYSASAPVINVTVQGNVIKEQELLDQIIAGTQASSLSGSPSMIGRIQGMFG